MSKSEMIASGYRLFLIGILCLLPFMLSACSSGGAGKPVVESSVRTIDIAGPEFARQYNFPRSRLTHMDYIGMYHGYHYLAVYQPEVASKPTLQFYYRTLKSELPPSFPDSPQKPIQSSMAPR